MARRDETFFVGDRGARGGSSNGMRHACSRTMGRPCFTQDGATIANVGPCGQDFAARVGSPPILFNDETSTFTERAQARSTSDSPRSTSTYAVNAGTPVTLLHRSSVQRQSAVGTAAGMCILHIASSRHERRGRTNAYGGTASRSGTSGGATWRECATRDRRHADYPQGGPSPCVLSPRHDGRVARSREDVGVRSRPARVRRRRARR